MLKLSRVSGTLDTRRLGQAVSHPGIDPRTWVSLAIVNHVVIDPAEGPFADITLMPLAQEKTARVGVEYAGNGFGVWAPIEIGDEVLVEAPSGNPDEGLVITRRLYSRSDPPPQAMVDNPTDLIIVVKEGRSLRIAVSGGGQVLLGSADATLKVARIGDKARLSAIGPITDLQALLDARYAIANPLSNLPPADIVEISTGSDDVRSS